MFVPDSHSVVPGSGGAPAMRGRVSPVAPERARSDRSRDVRGPGGQAEITTLMDRALGVWMLIRESSACGAPLGRWLSARVLTHLRDGETLARAVAHTLGEERRLAHGVEGLVAAHVAGREFTLVRYGSGRAYLWHGGRVLPLDDGGEPACAGVPLSGRLQPGDCLVLCDLPQREAWAHAAAPAGDGLRALLSWVVDHGGEAAQLLVTPSDGPLPVPEPRAYR